MGTRPTQLRSAFDVRLPRFGDAEADSVSVVDIIGAQPTLLVLLRHADCPFCELHVGRLLAERDTIGRVVLATFDADAPQALQQYLTDLPAEWVFLADRERVLYQHVLARQASTFRVSFHPRVLGRVVASMLNHRRLRRPGADLHQLGADIVVQPGGEIYWSHLSNGPEDRPSIAEIVDVMRQAESVSDVRSREAL